MIVRLFLDPETNPNNAQLIYTTHDVTHFDTKMLRKDQIWMCQKDAETGATELYSLDDFEFDEDDLLNFDLLAKDYYLGGYFYGVPDIGASPKNGNKQAETEAAQNEKKQ